MDQQMEMVNCNLCKSQDLRLLYKGRDNLFFAPYLYQLVRCKQCGLVFVNPRPEEMSSYYLERVEEVVEDGFSFLDPDRVRLVERFKKRGKILDVACGHGYFLMNMSKEGWDVYGNELSQSGCAFARGKLGLKNIYIGDILTLDLPLKYFDVVTMWHTLEHMKYPRETLEKIHALLKDDGLLIVEVPDFSNLQCKVFKDKCQGVDLPRHLYHFTPVTLKKMLYAAGFEIKSKDFFVNPRITFVTLKYSFMRLLRIERPLAKKDASQDVFAAGLRRTGFLWEVIRSFINLIILFLSFLLELMRCDLSMRVYCRKSMKGAGV